MQEKLIDIEVALDRLGGDREFLLELLDEMNNQMEPTMAAIEAALASSDYEQLRSVAHGMRGASSNLGADRISNYFKQLEQMGDKKTVAGAEIIVEKIKQTHTEMLEFLKTI